MRWDWSETADERVVDLWQLKNELGEEREVVYAKWFKGRATCFSKDLFTALLNVLGATEVQIESLPPDSRRLYHLLLDDSPQTPKMLRAGAELEGKTFEGAFNRAMRPLWELGLLVGVGEIDEGAYPALAIGATKNLFEELWEAARDMDRDEAERLVAEFMPPDSSWGRFLKRVRKKYGA